MPGARVRQGSGRRESEVCGEGVNRMRRQMADKRLYLETMERVFGSADKIIIDSNGVVPILSLGPRHKR
jgi:hypothetical protein